jgi:hypothetical protein
MSGLCKQSHRFLATEIDDETILLDLHGGELFALDGPARAIWHALDTVKNETSLATFLGERYNAPLAQIGQDISLFLSELRAAGLLA